MAAAVAHFVMRKNITSWRENTHHLWLNLLLVGGAIFGLVDHWWNGELFYIGKNIAMDISLGIMITIAITAIWSIIFITDKLKATKIAKN
jgi:hypothetical protein